MIIIYFWIDEKDGNSHFFEEIISLANITMNVTFKIFFLILSNMEVKFNNQKLQ